MFIKLFFHSIISKPRKLRIDTGDNGVNCGTLFHKAPLQCSLRDLCMLYISIKSLKTRIYTEYAGCAITTGIPVKFGTAHGRSRPEVGNNFCIRRL